MKKESKEIEFPCKICGKEVRWGMDGCPVVKRDSNLISVLFGQYDYMVHYECDPHMKKRRDKRKQEVK